TVIFTLSLHDALPIWINFFKEPLELKRAAEYISLSDEVLADANNIATALEPDKPGDNRVAVAISKLQHEKVLNNGTATFEEQYRSEEHTSELQSRENL